MSSQSGRDLAKMLNYTGMEKAVRSVALDEKLAKAEEIAVMSELEVCELVMEEYEIAYHTSEQVGLVRNSDIEAFNKLIKVISR